MKHRLRDGTSFVACAPQAFADPSASTAIFARALIQRSGLLLRHDLVDRMAVDVGQAVVPPA
ncbi:MAG: hypothetical protein WCJ21_10345, partial [Planctomycetota bacterium]